MTTLPVAPFDIEKIVAEFERKLGKPLNRDEHGVGISNADKTLLDWKYWPISVSIIHCYKSVNNYDANKIKVALVKRGAFALNDDIIPDGTYKEKPLFVFLRNLRQGESSEELYES